MNFEELTLEDFNGLEFDLSNEGFFRRVEGYGIELVPIDGWSVKVAGHGYNNGYYSDNLTLEVFVGKTSVATYDITECQDVEG